MTRRAGEASALTGNCTSAAQGHASDVAWAVGDVVFCPGRGVGTICDRRERDARGGTLECLVIRLSGRQRGVTIPVSQAQACGLRPPATAEEFDDALVALTCTPASHVPSWQARLKINREKLARGTVRDAAEVIRDLAWLGNGRGLGLSERGLYEKARAILESELAFGFGLDEDHARRRLDQLLACARPAEVMAPPLLEPDRR